MESRGSFDLTGRTVLVTGAGQGVGAGIAIAMAARRAAVVVNDIDAPRAAAMVDRIRADGGEAAAMAFDVTDRRAVAAAVGDTRIDVLVNNAGNGGTDGITVTSFREMDPSDWEGPIRVNLYGVLHCCKAVIDGMCDRGWGRIITISSGAGTAGTRIGVTPYSAGKGGAIAFTRSLALEVARDGVTANTLAIGLMDVPDPTVTAQMARPIPVGRTGRPADVAAACVWLASDEAEWVTGQTVQVNGGAITT